LEQLVKLGYIPKIAASLGKCSPPFWYVGVFEMEKFSHPLNGHILSIETIDLKGQTH
jgi:hypothetical protein